MLGSSGSNVIVVRGRTSASTQEPLGKLGSGVRTREMEDEEVGEGGVLGQAWDIGDVGESVGDEGRHKGGCAIL